jgi:ferredoxin
LITLETDDIRSIPAFHLDESGCIRCEKCVAGCPGLAISLVDYRKDADLPVVSLPFEFNETALPSLHEVVTLDTEGNVLGTNPVLKIKRIPKNDRTVILQIKAPGQYADRIAGVRIQESQESISEPGSENDLADETIICRCERVTAGEIRDLIRAGYRDMNEIKTVSRAGMGACGGKTCTLLIHRLFREEGVPNAEIIDPSKRPLFTEVPLSILAGIKEVQSDD